MTGSDESGAATEAIDACSDAIGTGGQPVDLEGLGRAGREQGGAGSGAIVTGSESIDAGVACFRVLAVSAGRFEGWLPQAELGPIQDRIARHLGLRI